MKTRVIVSLLVILSFFFLPWWLVLPLVLWHGVYFAPSYELILFGFTADVLYGASYTYTFYAGLFCIIVYIIRSYIRT
jgi:hypothetical protein